MLTIVRHERIEDLLAAVRASKDPLKLWEDRDHIGVVSDHNQAHGVHRMFVRNALDLQNDLRRLLELEPLPREGVSDALDKMDAILDDDD